MVVGVKIPDTCRAIVRAGDDESTILPIVKRENPALVALKECVNPFVFDIPDLVLNVHRASVVAKAITVSWQAVRA